MKTANLEVRYRPGYVATKQELSMAAPSQAAAITEFIENPLDATSLGLTGQFLSDRLRVTVDLHDVHLEHQSGHSIGRLEFTYLFGSSIHTTAMRIDVTDALLPEALKNGYETTLTGFSTAPDSIRVLVRDSSTGAAGSLRIPVR
jgi:hypothetical protein